MQQPVHQWIEALESGGGNVESFGVPHRGEILDIAAAIRPCAVGLRGVGRAQRLRRIDTPAARRRVAGEIAAIELIRREKATAMLPLERINLVGPDTLTGKDIAAIWSKVLKRPIAYGGDDTGAFEHGLRRHRGTL